MITKYRCSTFINSCLLIMLTTLLTSCLSSKTRFSPADDIDWKTVPEGYNEKHEGIPYGTIETISYYSTVTECDRKCCLLLPDGYSADKKYPVIYLLHGVNGDEDQWLTGTQSQYVFGNSIAAGTAVPMVVVMPNVRAAKNNWEPETSYENLSEKNFFAFDNFINDLRECLMPYINSHYSVYTDRKNTALAGLSLGGREALYIGVKMQTTFGALGAFSPAQGVIPVAWFPSEYTLMKRKELTFDKDYIPSPFILSVGDNDTVVCNAPRTYEAALRKNKVPHMFYFVPGGHDRVVWENNLYQFITRLFK